MHGQKQLEIGRECIVEMAELYICLYVPELADGVRWCAIQTLRSVFLDDTGTTVETVSKLIASGLNVRVH